MSLLFLLSLNWAFDFIVILRRGRAGSFAAFPPPDGDTPLRTLAYQVMSWLPVLLMLLWITSLRHPQAAFTQLLQYDWNDVLRDTQSLGWVLLVVLVTPLSRYGLLRVQDPIARVRAGRREHIAGEGHRYLMACSQGPILLLYLGLLLGGGGGIGFCVLGVGLLVAIGAANQKLPYEVRSINVFEELRREDEAKRKAQEEKRAAEREAKAAAEAAQKEAAAPEASSADPSGAGADNGDSSPDPSAVHARLDSPREPSDQDPGETAGS